MSSPDHLHVHVLTTADGPLLVDTGAVGSERELHAGLAKLEASPTRVLITHGHVDHWGLAVELSDRVLAHPNVTPSLSFARAQGGPEPPRGWPERDAMARAFSGFARLIAGVPEVEAIADGQKLGDWEVLWTPGHDPGHVCLYREADGVLLCGDLLLPGFTPNIQPGWDGSDALAQFLASLERVAALPVKLVLPAHGDAYADARTRARELLEHHGRRLNVLRAKLAQGAQTEQALSDAAFLVERATPADQMLSVLETRAHLDHLRALGEASQVSADDDRWQAQPAARHRSRGLTA
jgi:glyoxylase-like metal-dependent hydrolase (beta-lactamase superfamily II)